MHLRDTAWLEAIDKDWSGSLHLHVRGKSMLPTLQPGDEVLVESVQPKELRPGDWVVIRTSEGLLVHRFLRFTSDGRLLTKGDAHYAPDPPWTLRRLKGRVTDYVQGGQIKSVHRSDTIEVVRRWWHRIVANMWLIFRSLILAVFLLGVLLIPKAGQAAVTLILFDANSDTNHILVEWETATEIDMSGFYVWRSQALDGEYERISEFIRHEGDQIFGAYYTLEDTTAESQIRYYYKLESEETNGTSVFYDTNPQNDQPVSACIDCPTPTPTQEPTEEPTDDPETPTDTPTASSTPEPSAPTAIPTVYARFWTDATSLDAGQCTTLRWQTDHAARVELNGEGVPGGYSEEQVCPCADQTYVLRAFGHDGSYEEDTIDLNVSGACTPVPPGSTPTPTRTPRPTQTPSPTPRPTRVPDRATATPRPTQTSGAAQTTPSPTASPEEWTTSPLTTPDPDNPVLSSPLSPSPTSATGRQIPTRTPSTTGNRSDIQGVNARSGGFPVWLIIALIAGTALTGAGGWGIWRAWKENTHS